MYKLYGFNYEDLSGDYNLETQGGIACAISAREIEFVKEFETEEDAYSFMRNNSSYDEYLLYDGVNYYN